MTDIEPFMAAIDEVRAERDEARAEAARLRLALRDYMRFKVRIERELDLLRRNRSED